MRYGEQITRWFSGRFQRATIEHIDHIVEQLLRNLKSIMGGNNFHWPQLTRGNLGYFVADVYIQGPTPVFRVRVHHLAKLPAAK